MEYLLTYMENTMILSAEDIVHFKAYITKKYADLAREERAKVLADALNRVVDMHLEGIDPAFRKDLKQRLFQHTLARQQHQISKRNVFEEIVAIDVNPEAICIYAMAWMEKNISEIASEFNLEDLKNYVQKIKLPELEIPMTEKLQPETVQLERVQVEVEIVQMEMVQPKTVQMEMVQPETVQMEMVQPEFPHKKLFVKSEIRSINSRFYDLQEFQKIMLMILLDISEKLTLNKQLQRQLAYSIMGIMMLIIMHATFQMLPLGELYELIHNEDSIVIESSAPTMLPLSLEQEKKPLLIPIVDLEHFISVIPLVGEKTKIQANINVVSMAKKSEAQLEKPEVNVEKNISTTSLTSSNVILLKDVSFDIDALKTYLIAQNSTLAESPYFETIIDTATSHDIDPRLLFAIAGQEQSLVKRTNKNASKIANNPFNVYGSWQKYNTSIADSSEVVCNTINNRLSTKPKDADPLIWLNRTYAEDQEWHQGVRAYYNTLLVKTNFN